jgi:glycosyltransferase involved in cell wall biosynthesis
MRILHLTPHLGGGVGTVVRGYLDYCSINDISRHYVLSLDSLNDESKLFLNKVNIPWVDCAANNYDLIDSMVTEADIVLIHWWNQPLLQFLLMNHSLPASRVALWSHISGQPSPNNFNDFILHYPDQFVFTTPLSYFTPEIQRLDSLTRDKIMCIWSTAGVDRLDSYWQNIKKVSRLSNSHISVGYVGNLDYTKLNSGFLDSAISIKGADELVIVGPSTKKFQEDLSVIEDISRLKITGFISEDEKFKLMADFNIFGYPLARHHYGTCDQAIQEAMALGVPVVALNNPMESYMINHGRNGLIASNLEEYVSLIERLIADSKLRHDLGQNAREYALNEFSIKKMFLKWRSVFEDLEICTKTKKVSLSELLNIDLAPSDVFIKSLDCYAGLFAAYKNTTNKTEIEAIVAQIKCLSGLPQWSSPTKSTASHYSKYFNDDEFLTEWSSLTLDK